VTLAPSCGNVACGVPLDSIQCIAPSFDCRTTRGHGARVSSSFGRSESTPTAPWAAALPYLTTLDE